MYHKLEIILENVYVKHEGIAISFELNSPFESSPV